MFILFNIKNYFFTKFNHSGINFLKFFTYLKQKNKYKKVPKHQKYNKQTFNLIIYVINIETK